MEVIQFTMQYNAKTKDKDLNDYEKISIIKKMLNVKKYMSVRKKEDMIKKIIKTFITYDGKLRYSSFEKDLNTIICLIKEYTDLNIDENGYDLLCKEDLLEYVIGSFGKEYEICLGIMNTYMQDIELERIKLEDL